MRLNLGCSDQLLPDFVNVDCVWPAVWPTALQFTLVDLRRPWPWPNGSVSFVRAWDIVEHLPNKIHTMNEMWRVLMPGGQAELVVPTTDGRGAFQDPQHCSFWTPNDLYYYTAGDPHRERFGNAYGVKARFRVLEKRHEKYADEVWKMTAILEAVKK